MNRKFLIHNPLFHIDLWVFVSPKDQAAKYIADTLSNPSNKQSDIEHIQEYVSTAGGLSLEFISSDGCMIDAIWLEEKSIKDWIHEIVAHEVTHSVDKMLSRKGINHSDDTTSREVFAYVVGYLVDQIHTNLNKKRKNGKRTKNHAK